MADAAHLTCLLVNRRSASGSASGGGGGGGGSSATPGGSAALSFVTATSSSVDVVEPTSRDKDGDDDDVGGGDDVYRDILDGLDAAQIASVQSRAFGLVVVNLLDRINGDPTAGGAKLNDEAEIVHFFVSAFASLDLRSTSTAISGSGSGSTGPDTTSSPIVTKNKRPAPILAETLSKITSIGMWQSMPVRYRDLELKKSAMLRRRWGAWKKSTEEKNDSDDKAGDDSLVSYLPHLVDTIFAIVEDRAIWRDGAGGSGVADGTDQPMQIDDGAADDDESEDDTDDEGEPAQPDPQQARSRRSGDDHSRRIRPHFALLNRGLELLADLLLLPPARRHVRPYLLSRNFAVRLSLSAPYLPPTSLTPAGRLFRQLHAMLAEAINFGYDDATGSSLTDEEVASRLHERAHILQKLCHRHYADSTSDIIYSGVARVCDSAFLKKNLDLLEMSTLKDLCRRLRLVDDKGVVTLIDDGGASSRSDDESPRLRSYHDDSPSSSPHIHADWFLHPHLVASLPRRNIALESSSCSSWTYW